jgi:predicted  nucleic acid-binding Zn-ribbon protein
VSIRDRINSFLGGVLHPEDLCSYEAELAETIEEAIVLAKEVERLRTWNHELRNMLVERNRELERQHQQLLDLRDVVDLRQNNDAERWFGA